MFFPALFSWYTDAVCTLLPESIVVDVELHFKQFSCQVTVIFRTAR